MKMLLVTCLIVLSAIRLSYAEDYIKRTGTFSDLAYHEESGDVLGFEIRIVVARRGYQGTFQYSEGRPSDLILLENIIIDKNVVKFTIKGDPYFSGDFVGNLTATHLTGKIIFEKNGKGFNLNLKRGESYWD